jgi:flavorubredoxin
MPTIFIIYDSKTGNTESLAQAIMEGAESYQGINVVLRKIGKKFSISEFETADAIILGSPAQYATVTPEMNNLLVSIKNLSQHGKISLHGKVGATFGSYGWDGGWSIEYTLKKFMNEVGIKLSQPIVLSVDAPSEKVLEKAKNLGKKIAEEITK